MRISQNLLRRQYHIVAYLLKARTVEPEKQPLLANGSESAFVSTQRRSKHISAATNPDATIKELCFLLVRAEGLQAGRSLETATKI
jgi:hypothetical protein